MSGYGGGMMYEYEPMYQNIYMVISYVFFPFTNHHTYARKYGTHGTQAFCTFSTINFKFIFIGLGLWLGELVTGFCLQLRVRLPHRTANFTQQSSGKFDLTSTHQVSFCKVNLTVDIYTFDRL